jgi:trimeric autotransporter adhesin
MRAALSWMRHLLVVPILLGLASVGSAQEVRYVYDDFNRLVGVIDPSGAAAQYTYDAVGNVLAITRYSAGQVAILGFSPGRRWGTMLPT